MSGVSTLIVKDMGWNRTVKDLKRTENIEIKIGLQAGSVTKATSDGKEGGLSLPQIAAVNEFGSTKRKIPARPFLAPTMESQKDLITQRVLDAIRGIEDGRINPFVAFNAIGSWHADEIKRYLTNLRKPPNAPSTIARKKSDNPLIDTGQMRASIRHVLERRNG